MVNFRLQKDKITSQLHTIFKKDQISIQQKDLLAYGRDLWPLSIVRLRHQKVMPAADWVVWPEDEKQISELLRLANKEKFPVIPYGAGSGVCGGAVPVSGGVSCDLRRMNKVIEVDAVSHLVTAQTGIMGEKLEQELNQRGFSLGHSPQSLQVATLGGLLATRSAGQFSTKYGNIEEMVVSLTAVLPTGRVVQTKKTPRSSTGPNLNNIFLGSEGTLAILTEATLRIHGVPEKQIFSSFLFKTVEEGLDVIRNFIQKGIYPACVRLYDEADTAFLAKAAGLPLQGVLLILIFEGVAELVDAEMKIVEKNTARHGKALGEAPAMHWWKHRYDFSKAVEILQQPKMILDTVEVATTWGNLMPLYQTMKKKMGQLFPVMAHFSHFYSDGASIYFTFFGKAEDEEAAYLKMWEQAMEGCLAAGGTISHHHGIGLLRAPWLPRELNAGMEIIKQLKKMLDPNNILNPGKLGLSPFETHE